ncbi:unnamed protein product [Dibothriocephalus latus]|uniref:BACK domain-containing protein n=1 Tax=Dibothriocephalus latus TaxID=60516 RepID=A0A3P7NX45_DIBLA|nr:unnamed protein product [Dibothriocephalus latus]
MFPHLKYRDFYTKLPIDALIRVIRDEDLKLETEGQVVLAISQWIGAKKQADGTERLPELLREIRWNAVSNEIWRRFASDESWLRVFPYFGDYMKECEPWCGNANHRLTPSPFNQKARFYNKKITHLMGTKNLARSPKYTLAVHDVNKVVIIGGYKERASNAVTIFDAPTQRMKPAAPMTVARCECSAARCGDFIMVFGGRDIRRRILATYGLFRPLKNE